MKLIAKDKNGPWGLDALPLEKIGLLVQSVEPGSPADRGRLISGDKIFEINNTNLLGKTRDEIRDSVKSLLQSSELRLRVIPSGMPLPGATHSNGAAEMFEAEEKQTGSGTKVAHVSPTRKIPGTMKANNLQAANTRKSGKRIEVVLQKANLLGFGFFVCSRDNSEGVTLIKKIVPNGPAQKDGRLRAHDRLEEIDGVEMNGKKMEEVVQFMKTKPVGSVVKIIVTRQTELDGIEEREIVSSKVFIRRFSVFLIFRFNFRDVEVKLTRSTHLKSRHLQFYQNLY